MRQQAEDGGWHSATYGQFRDGAAVTALVLYTISHLRDELHARHRKRLERGYQFLQPGIRKRGCAAAPDGTLDFPTYASSMTLVAARRLGLEVPKDELKWLTEFVIRAQLTERNGFKPADPNHGGWDLMAGSREPGITSGTNVSVSRLALEALRGSKHEDATSAIARAAAWIKRCQNWPGDGGFFFHPQPDHLGNKAQWEDEQRQRPRSYGSATCDGIRCLLLCGAKPDDQRVAAGLQWLTKHAEVERVPGFEKAPPELGWKDGLWYYYVASLAALLPHLPQEQASKLRNSLVSAIVTRQRSEGSWKNASSRMREDDPLIATCFAVIALGEMAASTKRVRTKTPADGDFR